MGKYSKKYLLNDRMNGRKLVREERGQKERKNSSNLSSELTIKYIKHLITFFKKCHKMVKLNV